MHTFCECHEIFSLMQLPLLSTGTDNMIHAYMYCSIHSRVTDETDQLGEVEHNWIIVWTRCRRMNNAALSIDGYDQVSCEHGHRDSGGAVG